MGYITWTNKNNNNHNTLIQVLFTFLDNTNQQNYYQIKLFPCNKEWEDDGDQWEDDGYGTFGDYFMWELKLSESTEPRIMLDGRCSLF